MAAGAEKVIINSAAVLDPNLISEATGVFGSQSIVVSVDVKRGFFDKLSIRIRGGSKKAGIGLDEHLRKMDVKPVEAFDTDDFTVPARTSSDFSLD